MKYKSLAKYIYRAVDVHGIGISESSTRAVLETAKDLRLAGRADLDRQEIATISLRNERSSQGGHKIAANDVFTIVFGNIAQVYTRPDRPDEAEVRPVELNTSDWIEDHVTVAFNPNGTKHSASNVLERLFADGDLGRKQISLINELSQKARASIGNNVSAFADAINEYRELFRCWTGGSSTRNVDDFMNRFRAQTGSAVCGWKPPGAGSSESVVVISPNAQCRDIVLAHFAKERWIAWKAEVTDGLRIDKSVSENEFCLSAPHRLDFIGAGDLGQDPAIGAEGCCFSCAIQPRSQLAVLSA